MVTHRRRERRAASRRPTHLALRVRALRTGRLRALRCARTTVLFFLRRRRTGLIRRTRRLLRLAYNSRVKRVARYKICVSPAPSTRRQIKERMRLLKSYLQRRPRRRAKLKRTLALAVPERRVRRQLHRLVRHVSAAAG